MAGEEGHLPMSTIERTRTSRRRISTGEGSRHAEERRVYEVQRRQLDLAVRERHPQLMRQYKMSHVTNSNIQSASKL
ncbi:hypothetical protein Y032_0002g748 [Ancylostoma ceylanicum]|nr:hypothetical protein Y032_0002g748 [Ancylostoma ceylanicum]